MPDRTGRRSGDMAERGEREVRACLEAYGVRGVIRTFEESTHNAELAARELEVELGQIANTILLLVDGAPVYLDPSLRRYGTIYPAAGETNNMFQTTPGELAVLTGAKETDLAKAENPEQ